MKRRRLLTLLAGIGGGGALFGYLKSDKIATAVLSITGDGLEHEIRVHNRRETEYDVRVVVEFDTEVAEFGPYRLPPEEQWGVTQVTSSENATLGLYLDEEHVWTDTHEIPPPDTSGRLSRYNVTLVADGEIDTQHVILD